MFFFIIFYKFPFVKVCIPADYTNHAVLKNHHEAIRSFDTLMKFYPEKVVSGTQTFSTAQL